MAQKSPSYGSKIPLWIGRQGWREGITRFTEGTCLGWRTAPHANFTDSVESSKVPVSRHGGKTAYGRQNTRSFAIISRRIAPPDEKWGKSSKCRARLPPRPTSKPPPFRQPHLPVLVGITRRYGTRRAAGRPRCAARRTTDARKGSGASSAAPRRRRGSRGPCPR